MAKFASVRNIDELAEYGKALSNCSEILNATRYDLVNETNRVCEGWDDDKAMRFVEEIKNKASELNKLAEILKDFSTYIDKSCEILRDYENVKL